MAKASDLDWLVRTDADLFGRDAWSAQVWESSLGDTLVSEPDGYLVSRCVVDTADLDRIAVIPTVRRQGVATRLLQAAFEQHPGARWLLEVSSDNQTAIEFYQRHGFVEIDRRIGYYADGGDALVMERAR